MFDFSEELKKLPQNPGVYIMHDARDAIIYVGKAINLKNRVRSYFRESTNKTIKIQKMVSQIDHFEYIVTDSELEALVLENNLIKEHRPKYNTMLKDDKTYPYIKVTLGEEYPRLLFSRIMKKDKCRYFGPYTSAGSVKDTIDLISKIYKIRTCNKSLPAQIGKCRACLNYHMKQCDGPCIGAVSQEEYRQNVDKAMEFLNGNYSPVIRELEEKMNQASERMEFEDAIRYRDLLTSVKSVAQKQKITESVGEDKDIIALARDEKDAVVQVFFVRDGRLIGREHFYMTNILNEGSNVTENGDSEILSSFIKQFYAGTPYLPRNILLPQEIEDAEVIEQWLGARRGGRVKILVPKIGTKEKLVELARKNAEMVLDKDKDRIQRETARTLGAAAEIASLLGMDKVNRIEAFDISNINGFETVGSMVVFEKGKSHKSDYRKFRIRSVSGPDDYGCMKEVLERRFVHGLEEKKSLEEKDVDVSFGSFTKFPDLLLMDGGKGQVNIAVEVLSKLGIHIPVCGMVKDDHHRTRGLYYQNEEIEMAKNSEAFRLITRIQDEAHRFAIEYHRSLLRKTNVHSILDDINGIGPARRKALMRYFKSLEDIKRATREELMEVPQINAKAADEIRQFFDSSPNQT